MVDLIRELIPHAPNLGLYVAPHIPAKKLRNALKDYAPSLDAVEVVALFDATLMGSARDGILFTADRMVFQNSNFQAAQDVRYDEIVQVEQKRGVLKGQRIVIQINRARATFTAELNISAKPRAAEYLRRFLHEAMIRPHPASAQRTDWGAVVSALRTLRDRGCLSETDYGRLLAVAHA